jgi:hypothetical protein
MATKAFEVVENSLILREARLLCFLCCGLGRMEEKLRRFCELLDARDHEAGRDGLGLCFGCWGLLMHLRARIERVALMMQVLNVQKL